MRFHSSDSPALRDRPQGVVFSDTPNGAQASATHYYLIENSLIETAKAIDLDSHALLRAMLTRLPYASKLEAMEALLPRHVKLNT